MNQSPAPALRHTPAKDVLWLQRQYLVECAALIESLGVSLGEAAFRGSDNQSEVLLRQIRLVLLEAIGICKALTAAHLGGGA